MSRRTRSTRRRWPPESVPTFASQGISLARPAMMSRMRASPAHSYSGMSPTTARSTVSSSFSLSNCPSTPTRTAPLRSTRPSSGSSMPAITDSSVDLPSPLRPTMPMRSPSSTPSDTLSNTVFVGKSTRTFSQPSINAIDTNFLAYISVLAATAPKRKRERSQGPASIPTHHDNKCPGDYRPSLAMLPVYDLVITAMVIQVRS